MHFTIRLYKVENKLQYNLENSNFDSFIKYSLIRNKYGTYWLQRIGPIHNIFLRNVYNKICLGAYMKRFKETFLRTQNL